MVEDYGVFGRRLADRGSRAAQRGDCCWTRPPQVNLLIRCESLLALTIKCLAENNKKQK
jgi:hypothetical protein